MLICKEIFNDKQSNIEILKILEWLQNERQWAVIVFRLFSQYLPIEWLPFNRNIETGLGSQKSSLQHPVIKYLFDVIRNPDYDIYDVTNRWVMSKGNFFSHNCLKKVKMIHITVYHIRFAYVPMALALLKKVNTHRSRVKREPLKIVFYTRNYYRDQVNQKPYAYERQNFRTFNWAQHPFYKVRKGSDDMEKMKNKSNVYIHIFTGKLGIYNCRKKSVVRELIEAQDYHYRQFLLQKKDECFNDESYKTFGSPEELFDHINDDLCYN